MQETPHILPVKRGPSVTLANAVVQSAQQLTLTEKRLVMLAVSRIDPRSKVLPERPIKVTAEEFAEAFNLSPRDAYAELRRGSDSILAKHITRQREGSRGTIVERYAWLSRADYATGEGWIALRFNSEIAPYLVDLRSRFTRYQLAQAGALRSLYSWRLLEHLEMFSRTGWWMPEVDEFNRVMETPDSYRANFAQVRRWVIEPAVTELRDKDGWAIAWEPIKRGRKVHALRFKFQRDTSAQLM